MQVRGVHAVVVHDREGADARAREAGEDRAAEAARADDEDMGRREARLARVADFRQRALPRIVEGRRSVSRRMLAVHPAAVAVRVMFLFPDRQAVLDRVDDLATGGKGFGTVRRGDGDPHRDVADCEVSEAVHATPRARAVAGEGRFHDARALGGRERLEGLVIERRHAAALVEVAYPALERGESAGCRPRERGGERSRVDWRRRELEGFHPPATGGMKTISSPSSSRRCQSLNAAFTATFSCDAGRRKP